MSRSFAWITISLLPGASRKLPVSNGILRRILRRLNHVDHGKEDRRQGYTEAEFIEAGTIGPV